MARPLCGRRGAGPSGATLAHRIVWTSHLRRQRTYGLPASALQADLVAGRAQAAMLATAFHSAMALRRCRWVAGAERLERGGTKRLRAAEKTLTNRCRYLDDRKPCIARSRRRNGRCEFSARLLSPLCERCSTSGMI